MKGVEEWLQAAQVVKDDLPTHHHDGAATARRFEPPLYAWNDSKAGKKRKGDPNPPFSNPGEWARTKEVVLQLHEPVLSHDNLVITSKCFVRPESEKGKGTRAVCRLPLGS